MKAWLTPQSLPAGTMCRRIFYPNSAEFSSIVDGLLLLVTDEANFEQIDTSALTPTETAAAFAAYFDQNIIEGCGMAGELAAFATDSAPLGWLECDGQPLDTVAYPELFAAIGYKYGGSGNSFNVPDLRDCVLAHRTSLADGSQNVGHSAGQRTRGIDVANMPAHTHTQPLIPGPPVQAGAGGFGVGFNPAYQTGSTGNGVPMDIRQRTIYALWCIRT